MWLHPRIVWFCLPWGPDFCNSICHPQNHFPGRSSSLWALKIMTHHGVWGFQIRATYTYIGAHQKPVDLYILNPILPYPFHIHPYPYKPSIYHNPVVDARSDGVPPKASPIVVPMLSLVSRAALLLMRRHCCSVVLRKWRPCYPTWFITREIGRSFWAISKWWNLF